MGNTARHWAIRLDSTQLTQDTSCPHSQTYLCLLSSPRLHALISKIIAFKITKMGPSMVQGVKLPLATLASHMNSGCSPS